MTEKKVTKRERFNQLLAITEVAKDEGLKAFIEHEIELLDNKKASNSKGNSPKQKANAEMANAILTEMEENRYYTITELMKEISVCKNYEKNTGEVLSNQKVSAIVSALSKEGKIERTTDKGRAYFKMVRG